MSTEELKKLHEEFVKKRDEIRLVLGFLLEEKQAIRLMALIEDLDEIGSEWSLESYKQPKDHVQNG